MKKIIIVGAGIGGLAAGHWLKKKGYEVKIYEGNDRPGGCVAAIRRGKDTVDVGAQAFVSNNKLAIGLLKEFGLYHLKRPLAPKLNFRLQDGSSFIYNNQFPYMPPMGLSGNLKQAAFILRHVLLGKSFPKYEVVRDIPEYDDTLALEMFNKPGDKPINDFLVTTMAMVENLGMPKWMNQYQFIHMMRNAMNQFFSLDGGNIQLIEKMADTLDISYESPVSEVVMEKGRVAGIRLSGSDRVEKADHLILATGPITAAKILPDELEFQKKFFLSTLCDPVTIPVFFLDRPLRREAWLYANDPRMARTFMYAWDEHGKNPVSIASGKSVVIGWSGHPMTGTLVDKSDAEVLEIARQDLELCIPSISDMVEEAMVFRHNSGAVRYPIGSYKKILDFFKQSDTRKDISFVSSMFGGAYMEAAVKSAQKAVNRITNVLGI